MRKAYIAKYPLAKNGDNLDEIILVQDTYWSPKLSKAWDGLMATRKASEPMLQGWYSDDYQTTCMATTNQPFKLS